MKQKREIVTYSNNRKEGVDDLGMHKYDHTKGVELIWYRFLAFCDKKCVWRLATIEIKWGLLLNMGRPQQTTLIVRKDLRLA